MSLTCSGALFGAVCRCERQQSTSLPSRCLSSERLLRPALATFPILGTCFETACDALQYVVGDNREAVVGTTSVPLPFSVSDTGSRERPAPQPSISRQLECSYNQVLLHKVRDRPSQTPDTEVKKEEAAMRGVSYTGKAPSLVLADPGHLNFML